MEITWLGHACFRLKGKEATVITDPYDQSVGYQLGHPSGDIVTVSHHHHDHDAITAVGGEPRVVDGPGEYEIKGVMIVGIQTFHDAEGGKKRGKNTAYIIRLDDVVICHLGDLGHVPSADQVEEMSNVDVLLVPVGGNYTINAAQAAEVISLVEPKIVIPMHYKTDWVKLEIDPVEKFTREMGLKSFQPQPKLVVTKSTLPAEQQIVVLEYRKG
ncbi:MAG: MBL fold metallo-hydrolase [Chloroflexi bacterium]|nr:MBL fold metallo-hydrolase [Chloroflexota bacterium]